MTVTTIAVLLLAVTFFTAGAASEREVKASPETRRSPARLRLVASGPATADQR